MVSPRYCVSLSSLMASKVINFVAASIVIIQVYVVTIDFVIVSLMILTILRLSAHSFPQQLSTICVAMDVMMSSMSYRLKRLTMLSTAFRWAKIPMGYSCVPLLMSCTLFSMVLSCIHWSLSKRSKRSVIGIAGQDGTSVQQDLLSSHPIKFPPHQFLSWHHQFEHG